MDCFCYGSRTILYFLYKAIVARPKDSKMPSSLYGKFRATFLQNLCVRVVLTESITTWSVMNKHIPQLAGVWLEPTCRIITRFNADVYLRL